MRIQGTPQSERLRKPFIRPGSTSAAAGHYVNGRRDVIDFQAYRAERSRPTPPTPPSGGRAA